MADTLDLGSSAARHKGSSPLLPTNRNEAQEQHSDAKGQSWAANPTHYGELVELADTLDLGSSAAKHKGSSPLLPTILTGISSVGLERTPDKRKVPGSIPGCPTNDMESEPIAHRPIPQIKLFDEIVLPPGSLYRSKCAIGVMVTSAPSKRLLWVQVPYGAPV